jgi:hypothetical protein
VPMGQGDPGTTGGDGGAAPSVDVVDWTGGALGAAVIEADARVDPSTAVELHAVMMRTRPTVSARDTARRTCAWAECPSGERVMP